MAQRTSLRENEGLRELVLAVVGLGLLVWLLDFPLRAAAAILVLTGSSGLHDLLDERYGLPEGSNGLFYGGSMVVVGLGGIVLDEPWFGLFAVPGLWFVLDGWATVRAGPVHDAHGYTADLDDVGTSEAMLRMQMLGSVHELLREATGPRTPAEVAAALGMTEERAADALDYLADRGRVEHVDGERYRAVPLRWGKAAPVVRFARWLPRRLARPFRMLLA